jgi:hypothetical protein
VVNVSGWLALSDERDAWSRLATETWRWGYAAAEAAHADDYARGYADGVRDVKCQQHASVEAFRIYLARWQGPRLDFGKPRDRHPWRPQ